MLTVSINQPRPKARLWKDGDFVTDGESVAIVVCIGTANLPDLWTLKYLHNGESCPTVPSVQGLMTGWPELKLVQEGSTIIINV